MEAQAVIEASTIAYWNPYIAELLKNHPPRYSWPAKKSQKKERKERRRK